MVLGDISMMVFPPKNISVIMKGVQKVVRLVCTTQHTQHIDQHVFLHSTCLQIQCVDNTIS
jgi:hypothetical protein